jgi:hypothetical protein
LAPDDNVAQGIFYFLFFLRVWKLHILHDFIFGFLSLFQICSTKLSWCQDRLLVIGPWLKTPSTTLLNWPLPSIAPFQGWLLYRHRSFLWTIHWVYTLWFIQQNLSGSTHVPIGYWPGSSWNYWPLLMSVDALTINKFE